MRRRRVLSAALLAAAGLAAIAGCRRAFEPARAAVTPPAPGTADTPEARQARERRAAAAAGGAAEPGVAVERSPLLLDPDYGAPVAGTIEEGAPVDVLLVEPGFFGIRTGEKGLAFVPARSVRLLPGAVPSGASPRRPRREIVPQIVPLTGDTDTPLPRTGSPVSTGDPAPGGGR
jgi:hypothetical protein